MSPDAMERQARVRRQRWVEGVMRISDQARDEIASPTALAVAAGTGFALERMGRRPFQVFASFQQLKRAWLSFTQKADA